jgi:hypothetical protein
MVPFEIDRAMISILLRNNFELIAHLFRSVAIAQRLHSDCTAIAQRLRCVFTAIPQ